MNIEEKSAICIRSDFNKICENAQESWLNLERSFRDYYGNIIDHDKYNDLYILRMKWILEEVIPQDHPCFKDHGTHHKLAKFLLDETNQDKWDEGEDAFWFVESYICDSYIDELYQLLVTLYRDYQD